MVERHRSVLRRRIYELEEELELLKARNEHAHTLLAEQAEKIRKLERRIGIAQNALDDIASFAETCYKRELEAKRRIKELEDASREKGEGE